jgi:hypothetical protein
MAHLHLTLGAKLESLFRDAMSANIVQAFSQHFGKDYFLSDSMEYYQIIGRAMTSSNINTYLFLNASNQVSFGVSLKDRKLTMLSLSYLEMANCLIEQIKDNGKVAQMLSSSGEEHVAFFRIRTVKRLLEGMLAPSRIRKLIIKLLDRATEDSF